MGRPITPGNRSTIHLGALCAAAALLACLGMASCGVVPAPSSSNTHASDEALPVSDKQSDRAYTYSFATIKTTGLEAARSVFSLAALSCEEEIEISRDLKITEDDMRTAASELRLNPEYLCSTGSFSYIASSPSSTEEYYVTSLKLTYDYDAALIPGYRAEMAEVVTAITSTVVTSDMTPYEKALALHDYLVSNCEYDETLQHYSAYDALVNHTGTCQAYSQAYKLLLGRVGIPCEYVSSEEMNHGWNMVNIDGMWYHVDVTWDDPIVIGGTLDEILHTYFMKGDASMAADKHYGWTANQAAPSDYVL